MKMKIDHIDTTWRDLDLDMDANMVNISRVSLWWCSIKEHLSNIWSSIQEKVKQHWGWVEKKGCL